MKMVTQILILKYKCNHLSEQLQRASYTYQIFAMNHNGAVDNDVECMHVLNTTRTLDLNRVC